MLPCSHWSVSVAALRAPACRALLAAVHPASDNLVHSSTSPIATAPPAYLRVHLLVPKACAMPERAAWTVDDVLESVGRLRATGWLAAVVVVVEDVRATTYVGCAEWRGGRACDKKMRGGVCERHGPAARVAPCFLVYVKVADAGHSACCTSGQAAACHLHSSMWVTVFKAAEVLMCVTPYQFAHIERAGATSHICSMIIGRHFCFIVNHNLVVNAIDIANGEGVHAAHASFCRALAARCLHSEGRLGMGEVGLAATPH